MSEFIPPYPKRHKKDLNPLQALYYARKDLLSIWGEEDFSLEFMSEKILKQHVFIANSPDTIRHVFVSNHKNYERKSMQMKRALEPLLGDGLFISEGETWKTRRSLQEHLFDNSHIRLYTKSMIETIDEMAGRWATQESGSELLALQEMGKLTAEIISRSLFGAELGAANAESIVKAFADYQSTVKQMALSNFLGLPDWLPNVNAKIGKARKSALHIHRAVDDIIEKASAHSNQDTLAAYLIAANNELTGNEAKLSKNQIRNEIITLFMAGHETTANSLAWAWYLISQAPDVEKKLHAELDEVLGGSLPTFDDINKLKYTRAIFDETLRLYPPVPILSRQSLGEDEIRGRRIPANSIMLIVPWLIQRHKKFWDKPDHFIPERFMPGAKRPEKFTYLPFSAGPRVCIGKSFGITESVLSLAILAQRFRLKLDSSIEVSHECRLTLRPKGNLPMKLVQR